MTESVTRAPSSRAPLSRRLSVHQPERGRLREIPPRGGGRVLRGFRDLRRRGGSVAFWVEGRFASPSLGGERVLRDNARRHIGGEARFGFQEPVLRNILPA